MSKKPNLLDEFTKDPNYTNRIKSAGGPLPEPQADVGSFFTRDDSKSFAPAGGLSRRWDNRFATERIPNYDAINDRFCKFNLKKKLQNGGSRKMTAPMNLGPRPLMGAQFPSSAGANSRPHHLNPINSNNRGGSPIPPLRVGENQNQDGESVSSAFTKSRNRLISLWDELGTPEEERASLHAYITTPAPSLDDVRTITDEIQRLVDVRSAAVEAEKAIELREGFLYLLQELAERYDHQGPATASEKAVTFKELSALITPFRNASLQAVEAIVCWGDLQRDPSLHGAGVRQPYLWKGVSYLHKMSGDTFFLARSRLGGLIGFELKANPLMDPRREVRNSDGSPAAKAKSQPSAYVPYARLTRAEAHLLEEAQRQAALRDIPGLTSTAEALEIQQRTRDEDETNEAMLEEEQDWVRKQGIIRSRGSILGEQHRAATDLQRVYRSHLARRYAGALREQKVAAVTIQMAVRRHLASVHVKRRRKEAEAAKKIQALHRGTFTRNRIHQIRHSHAAATIVQRVFRGHLARKYTDMLWYLHQCARKIQSTFRGFRTRKLVNGEVAAVRHMAAALIQSRWRGHAVRSNAKYDPEKAQKVVRLQAWFRGILDRGYVREIIVAKRAATLIQTQYRMSLAKRRTQRIRQERDDHTWEIYLGVANTAATRIQCGWRMRTAKERVNGLKEQRSLEQDRRAIELSLDERLALQEQEAAKSRSAVGIQAQIRGFIARRNFNMVRHLIFSAIQIQKVVRGHQSRQRSRAQKSVLVDHMEDQLSAAGLRDTVPSIVEQAKNAIQQEAAAEQELSAIEEEKAAGVDASAISYNEDEDTPLSAKNESATDASHQGEGVSVATIDLNNDVTAMLAPTEEPSDDDNDNQGYPEQGDAASAPPHEEAIDEEEEGASPSVANSVDDGSSAVSEEQEQGQVDDAVPTAASNDDDDMRRSAGASMIQRNVRGYQSRSNGGAKKRSRVARQKASSDSHAQCSQYAAVVLQRNLAPRSQLRARSRAHRIAAKQASRQAAAQERGTAAVLVSQLAPIAKARAEAEQRRNRRDGNIAASKRQAINSEREYASHTIANGLMPLMPMKTATRSAAFRSGRAAIVAESQEQDYARDIMGRFLTAVAAKQRAVAPQGDGASIFFEAQVGEQSHAAKMIQCAVRTQQARIDVDRRRRQVMHDDQIAELIDVAQAKREEVEEEEVSEFDDMSSEASVSVVKVAAVAPVHSPVEDTPPQQPSSPAASPTVSSSSAPSTPKAACASPAGTSSSSQEQEVDRSSPTPSDAVVPNDPPTTPPTTTAAPPPLEAEEEVPATSAPYTTTEEVDELAAVEEEVSPTNNAPEEVATTVEEPTTVAAVSTPPNVIDATTPPTSPTKEEDSEDSESSDVEEVTVRPPTAPDMSALRPYREDAGVPSPEEASTTVQSILRCWHSALIVDYWAAKKVQGAARVKEGVASTTIQCCFRSHQARVRVGELKAKKAAEDRASREATLLQEYEAAVEILRTEEDEVRRAQVEAANQDAAKFVRAERAQQRKADTLRIAATKIQCAWRCYNARFMRRWMHSVRAEKRAVAARVEQSALEDVATLKIQSATRQRQARDRTAVLREDKAARRQELLDREAKVHKCATTIQCMVRQHNARDKLHFLQIQKKEKDAAEVKRKADELARRLQELKEIEATKVRTVEEQAAAVRIQCAYRCYNARFERRWRENDKDRQPTPIRPSSAADSQSSPNNHDARENSAIAKVHAKRLDELRAAEERAQQASPLQGGPNPYATPLEDEGEL